MYRLLVADSITLGEASYPDVSVDYRAGIARAELLEIIGTYDALIVRSRTKVDAALLAAAPGLKVVGRAGVGVDNIDIDVASRRGVLIVNAPDANNVSAAELAIALMLSAARGVARADRLIRRGEWDRTFLGREVKGARLGIVGLGRIGSLVAGYAQGLGMQVMGFDPHISRHRAQLLNVELFDDLHEMLRRADFLTLHTPLTEETRGLIGATELALLPRGAVVVNAARGGLIDEGALAQALDSGQVFAAGLDVFEDEPPKPDNPLLHHDRVVMTSHLGANTAEAQARVGSEILERTVRALRGDYSLGVVNAPALAPEVVAALGSYLALGEALGKMVVQLAKGRLREIQVEFSGTFPIDPDPIAVAVTKGVLEPILTEPPTYVSAPSIAKERDIRVLRITAARSRGYTRHVLVTLVTEEGAVSVGGAVLDDHPRIVSINGYPIEIKPEGAMLVCTNYDRPGAIGKVGTVLGNAGVNISGMQLGRLDSSGLAMFVLTLDTVPSEEVLEVLRNLSEVIHSLQLVRL